MVKRHTHPRSGFFPFFPALFVPAWLASGRVSRLDFRMPAQSERGCAKHVWRLNRCRDDDGQETRGVSAAEKPIGTLIPSDAIQRLHGNRSPVRCRLGGGAAHVEPLATIAISPEAGASVQSTREGSGYQAYARFGVH
jgi:hypothetical protein